ncbi:MAG TPA: hypothetical protein DIT18_04750 [Pseudomonas sp.]|nr:hypothetical protein [Pseudomonas sp.]
MTLDFSRLEDGATLPVDAISTSAIAGDVERVDGQVVVTLQLPHAADAPEYVRFPGDLYPADGPVQLPGLELGGAQASTPGVIDWSQVITAEMKVAAAAEQHLARVLADTAERRAAADAAIAPLQDAVDLDDATEAEAELLKDWKRYRVALNRLPEQVGYPTEIDWPAPPA